MGRGHDQAIHRGRRLNGQLQKMLDLTNNQGNEK